ncbi:MAG: stage II sporulation protein D [Syntrophomonadaceae bacterium]|nr:stage II sporulation protein D [Syntrophomonadaceae bacterium]
MYNRLRRRITLVLTALLVLAAAALVAETLRKADSEPVIRLLISAEGSVVELPLEEYLVGVVLAEMPASFNFEALKAQAVCARTYTLNRLFSPSGHNQPAEVCDDINHCQAYTTPAAYLESHPENEWAVQKVRQAVAVTRGEVITVDGELIEPVYHSTCGGHTEDSQAVWGYEHDYLQGVPCLWDGDSPHYRKTLNISIEEFRRLLGLDSKIPLPTARVESTANGTVEKIAWGDNKLTGYQVRRALNLPSAKFTLTFGEETVAVTTVGSGHGVGLCQYGANGLAEEGKDYRQILHHYYRGITLYRVSY